MFMKAGKLVGFTSGTVTVRLGCNDTTYDERGRISFVRQA
jgi:hypothetical protein